MKDDCDCDCIGGYHYFPHSCGEPTKSPCLHCRPEEARQEANQVGWMLLFLIIILCVAGYFSQ